MGKTTILAVEDDADIGELLQYSLSREGWNVTVVGTAERGLALAKSSRPDAIVLDVMLPGMDGLEALKALKADPATGRIPVILATAKADDADVVAGLELGADDYVAKPFSPKVLAARIRRCVRAARGPGHDDRGDNLVRCGALELDTARHEAFCDGRRLEPTATEFALLELLARSPGWVFSRNQIIEAVRGTGYPVTDRAVDVQILGLRKKLGNRGEMIETVRGVGYRLRG